MLHWAKKCCFHCVFSKATQVSHSELQDVFQETSSNIFQINSNGKMTTHHLDKHTCTLCLFTFSLLISKKLGLGIKVDLGFSLKWDLVCGLKYVKYDMKILSNNYTKNNILNKYEKGTTKIYKKAMTIENLEINIQKLEIICKYELHVISEREEYPEEV